jgi:hypothetical protein
MKAVTSESTDWPSVGRFALEHFTSGWLRAAFSIFVLGWVLRGAADPVMKYWKEDREAKRTYQLELAKLQEAKEKRLSEAKTKNAQKAK